jgi:glutamate formiminotransferase/formiminotetrahydrofolate cyclodeaminase
VRRGRACARPAHGGGASHCPCISTSTRRRDPSGATSQDIRAGEYEALPKKLADAAWKPDAGPARFNERLGATVVGAREFLIAYNVNLNTRDPKLANEVALNIAKRDA